ncbi:hypothetical protein [Agaribacterium haliotis]|uniref:hypothetical protein n=1 Tax=Agaribacterium haliotis TaxID=2013869 RepID=UPI00117876D6|nr:hypothetical protein [Agaribacterium haliotis]
MNRLTVAIALSLAGLACQVQASELNYSSADFAFKGKDLLDALPTEPAKASVLYCRADLASSGAVDKVDCYGEAETGLLESTEQALVLQSFEPATVEEKAVPVRMSFRVAYTLIDDSARAILIPNLGTMQDLYGRNYVAPQERLDVADWYSAYSEYSWEPADAWLGEGDHARIAAVVESSGQPTLIRTVEANQAYERDAKIIKRSLKNSQFLPGSVNGKPVDMKYVVAVHYSEGHRAYARAH